MDAEYLASLIWPREEFRDPDRCFCCHSDIPHTKDERDKIVASGWRPPHLRRSSKRELRRIVERERRDDAITVTV